MAKKVKTKKGKASRKKEQHWPMMLGGPYSKEEGDGVQIFKCSECGAESTSEKGWNGGPDKHKCSPNCTCHTSDWTPGRGYSPQGKRNFDLIFPNAPGAGL